MYYEALLVKSPLERKKWRVIIKKRGSNNLVGTVDFGAQGYEDFTTHGDLQRKSNYLKRHAPGQNWTRSGMLTAGFWARWLLWNKRTLKASASDIKKKFFIKVIIPGSY